MKREEVTYVDLMETWSKMLWALFFYLGIVGGTMDFVKGLLDSLIGCLAVDLCVVFICWLPGMLLATFLSIIHSRLAPLNPAYMSPRCILVGRIQNIMRQEISTIGTGIALVAMLLSAGIIVIVSICGIIFQDEYTMLAAIAFGMTLSWGGALLAGGRLIYDAVRARRQAKSQVF